MSAKCIRRRQLFLTRPWRDIFAFVAGRVVNIASFPSMLVPYPGLVIIERVSKIVKDETEKLIDWSGKIQVCTIRVAGNTNLKCCPATVQHLGVVVVVGGV